MPYNHARPIKPETIPDHVLILRADGGAELQDRDQRTIWSSDSDPEFQEEFGGHDLLDENDIPDLLDFLVDSDVLTDDEADECEFDIESMEPDADEPDAIDADFEEVGD